MHPPQGGRAPPRLRLLHGGRRAACVPTARAAWLACRRSLVMYHACRLWIAALAAYRAVSLCGRRFCPMTQLLSALAPAVKPVPEAYTRPIVLAGRKHFPAQTLCGCPDLAAARRVSHAAGRPAVCPTSTAVEPGSEPGRSSPPAPYMAVLHASDQYFERPQLRYRRLADTRDQGDSFYGSVIVNRAQRYGAILASLRGAYLLLRVMPTLYPGSARALRSCQRSPTGLFMLRGCWTFSLPVCRTTPDKVRQDANEWRFRRHADASGSRMARRSAIAAAAKSSDLETRNLALRGRDPPETAPDRGGQQPGCSA